MDTSDKDKLTVLTVATVVKDNYGYFFNKYAEDEATDNLTYEELWLPYEELWKLITIKELMINHYYTPVDLKVIFNSLGWHLNFISWENYRRYG